MKKEIRSFEDLEVYQKLLNLHLEVHDLTIRFPKHEMYELGSQLRRSSNSIAANLAEGWNNRYVTIYLEGINRSLGELRETIHHLTVGYRKNYYPQGMCESLKQRYQECGKMLNGLESISSMSKHIYKTSRMLAKSPLIPLLQRGSRIKQPFEPYYLPPPLSKGVRACLPKCSARRQGILLELLQHQSPEIQISSICF